MGSYFSGFFNAFSCSFSALEPYCSENERIRFEIRQGDDDDDDDDDDDNDDDNDDDEELLKIEGGGRQK